MLKHLLDDGYDVRVIFLVKCYGDQKWLPLRAEFWMPFPPTVGLVLEKQGVDYPPVKTVAYHLGTNKFTLTLEEVTMWDYNEQDVLTYYHHAKQIGLGEQV